MIGISDIKKIFRPLGVEELGCARLSDAEGQAVQKGKRLLFFPRCAVFVLFPYPPSPAGPDGKTGNLPRYCRIRDYHLVGRGILEEGAQRLRELYPEGHYGCFIDVSPLPEVEGAVRAGLGKRGWNNLFISGKYGTRCFIGEIVTDLELETGQRGEAGCGECGLCLSACPGGALQRGADGGRRFVKERCASHISQKTGALEDWEKEILRRAGYAWGCDRCQDVCPHNRELPSPPPLGFREAPFYSLDPEEIEGLSNRDFRRRFGEYAFSYKGKAPLLRNLRILAGME